MHRISTAFSLLALLAVTAVSLLAPVSAGANCNVDPTLSYCVPGVIRNDACPTANTEIVWCPAGDMSLITLTIGVVDVNNNPCPGCVVQVDFRFSGSPRTANCNLYVCGTVGGMVTLTGVTNALGEVTFTFTGGGCGCVNMDWTAFTSGLVLCSSSAQFCVKSPDLTGDGTINFSDTFKFLPMLNAGQGYCADFNCSNTVNFQDVFQYLPHLNGAHSCPGSILPFAPCPPGACP
ncbi:MAG: hypothetical protein HKN20_11230 [Gemmatimonadetes bacterium]|nr:hypothetical protein [Gemmatimonadota bacterium]